MQNPVAQNASTEPQAGWKQQQSLLARTVRIPVWSQIGGT